MLSLLSLSLFSYSPHIAEQHGKGFKEKEVMIEKVCETWNSNLPERCPIIEWWF